jgi:hypothetical protein
MSCCKRAPGGICDHDRAERRERANLQRAQILHDMKRPGITAFELETLQRNLKEVDAELPSVKTAQICPNCNKFIEKGHSHESTAGGYEYYTCK